MIDVHEWVGNGIPAVSLVVAVIALWKSDRAQREANTAQRRIVEIEEQRDRDRVGESRRAVLRAGACRSGDAFKLWVRNVGQAEARNVQIQLDGEPASEHPAVPGEQTIPTLIGPRAEVGFLVAPTFRTDLSSELAVTWDDDGGTGRTFRTPLTF